LTESCGIILHASRFLCAWQCAPPGLRVHLPRHAAESCDAWGL